MVRLRAGLGPKYVPQRSFYSAVSPYTLPFNYMRAHGQGLTKNEDELEPVITAAIGQQRKEAEITKKVQQEAIADVKIDAQNNDIQRRQQQEQQRAEKVAELDKIKFCRSEEDLVLLRRNEGGFADASLAHGERLKQQMRKLKYCSSINAIESEAKTTLNVDELTNLLLKLITEYGNILPVDTNISIAAAEAQAAQHAAAAEEARQAKEEAERRRQEQRLKQRKKQEQRKMRERGKVTGFHHGAAYTWNLTLLACRGSLVGEFRSSFSPPCPCKIQESADVKNS